MRRAAKVDANHSAAVDNLRATGWSVRSLAAHGKGVLDLLVARAGFTCLLEVKDGGNVPSKRRLTADQLEFTGSWQGAWAIVEDASRAAATADNLKLEYDNRGQT